MAGFKQNYFQRRTKDRGPRSNNRISSPEVQVIGSDGNNLGILNTNEAISIAKEQGLDLIEIAPKAKPPVCKITVRKEDEYISRDYRKKKRWAETDGPWEKQSQGKKPSDHIIFPAVINIICPSINNIVLSADKYQL